MIVMRLMQCLILVVALICGGCVCMFVPCDRRLQVSGHVFDLQHKPISHATVEFYGVKKETDDTGCFYFGGLLAASGFNVSVTKSGYKPYREGKELAYYDIEVTLVPDSSEGQSSGVWHTLSEEQLSKYKDCSEH